MAPTPPHARRAPAKPWRASISQHGLAQRWQTEEHASGVSPARPPRVLVCPRIGFMDGPSGLDLLALLDQLPAVVWATDRELRLTYGRGAALKHFGPRGDDLVGAPVSTSAHRAALGGTATTWEYEWRGR